MGDKAVLINFLRHPSRSPGTTRVSKEEQYNKYVIPRIIDLLYFCFLQAKAFPPFFPR